MKQFTLEKLVEGIRQKNVGAERNKLIEKWSQTGLLRGEVSPFLLPAPINDSIYIVQNSQWTRYAEMWRMGMHDFFWLRVAER